MEKNDEKRKKNAEIWTHTQNPRRFPGFTVVVVVVTFFVKILDDFHDLVSECVSKRRTRDITAAITGTKHQRTRSQQRQRRVMQDRMLQLLHDQKRPGRTPQRCTHRCPPTHSEETAVNKKSRARQKVRTSSRLAVSELSLFGLATSPCGCTLVTSSRTGWRRKFSRVAPTARERGEEGLRYVYPVLSGAKTGRHRHDAHGRTFPHSSRNDAPASLPTRKVVESPLMALDAMLSDPSSLCSSSCAGARPCGVASRPGSGRLRY